MRVGNCPSCGAPVDFAAGATRVKVCEHCSTVVARGGTQALEALGKVAELADTESPLSLGLSGSHNGVAFRLVGRIQKELADDDARSSQASHFVWDEWCLLFDDGRTAWLSESEGAWNLMFEAAEKELPAFEKLAPLSVFQLRNTRFVVEELNIARTVSAQGELPDFHPRHAYADATGPKGVFVSLDYGGEPAAFVGSTVTLEQLGFVRSELQPTPRREALAAARCTQCNGPLELKAPDVTRRVGCPYCGALLDVTAGQLRLLQLLEKPPVQAVLPLGARGKLKGVEWTVLAFLMRSCRVEGSRYPWEEYLLWHAQHGFSWVMRANGHWSFLTPVAAGECSVEGRWARFEGESFKAYQSVMATTEWVQGECYWQVTQGEQAFAREFIAPPRSVNVDQTPNEVTVTLGEMLSPQEVMQAFGLKSLPSMPSGIAPAQLNVWSARSREAWKWAGLWSVLLVAVFVVLSAMSTRGRYLSLAVPVAADARPGDPSAMAFSEPFEVPVATPLEVAVTCPNLSNSWCGVQVDLVNEKSDEVISVYVEPSYYFGRDSDGSWSEGGTAAAKETDAVEAGTYVLRSSASWERPLEQYFVTVDAGGSPGGACFAFFLILLFAYPAVAFISMSQFETKRWEDSVFQSPAFEPKEQGA